MSNRHNDNDNQRDDVEATLPIRHCVSPFVTQPRPNDDAQSNVERTAMVILNAPIAHPPSPVFVHLWDHSSFRVCADGGANRLYQATANNNKYIPNLITGDLDSLQDHVREYYETQQGVRVVKQYDQDYNDLDKSVKSILAKTREHDDGSMSTKYDTCFVYGAFGGRVDQEMASIQALFVHSKQFSNLWLYNDGNAAVLLRPGQRHVLEFPNYSAEDNNDSQARVPQLGEGPTCGLIPIGAPCEQVTTTGLQWNLRQQSLEFGGLVSSSNRIVARTVEIVTSHPLLFTVEMQMGPGSDCDTEIW